MAMLNNKGQSLSEYSLIGLAIAVVAIVAVMVLGTSINDTNTAVSNALSTSQRQAAGYYGIDYTVRPPSPNEDVICLQDVGYCFSVPRYNQDSVLTTSTAASNSSDVTAGNGNENLSIRTGQSVLILNQLADQAEANGDSTLAQLIRNIASEGHNIGFYQSSIEGTVEQVTANGQPSTIVSELNNTRLSLDPDLMPTTRGFQNAITALQDYNNSQPSAISQSLYNVIITQVDNILISQRDLNEGLGNITMNSETWTPDYNDLMKIAQESIIASEDTRISSNTVCTQQASNNCHVISYQDPRE